MLNTLICLEFKEKYINLNLKMLLQIKIQFGINRNKKNLQENLGNFLIKTSALKGF